MADVRLFFSVSDPEFTAEDRREVANAHARHRYARCPDVRAAATFVSRRWYYERGGQAVLAEAARERLYGLPRGRFAEMAIEQAGRCAMPGCDAKPRHVDHDHATGRVRALLCHRCNIGLGHFERMKDQFARYLARFDKENDRG